MAKIGWRIQHCNQDFNGKYWGFNFLNGKTYVDRKYDAELLIRKGCSILDHQILDETWNPNKILVIRLGAYGDNLMITSALRGLRNKYPQATIHFYGSEPHNQILFNNPDINNIVRAPVQDIGHIVNDYDEVYDLFEHIEHNPDSDWRNAYELAEERLDVKDFIKPWEHRPVFVPTEEELEEAKHILKSYNFDPDLNKLILIHAESSSMIRRIRIHTALEVSDHYIEKGYKILFAGHDSATPNLEYKKCSRCDDFIAAELIGSVNNINMICPYCGEINTIQKTDKNKNIFFLSQLIQHVSPRIIFAMQKYVNLVIAVDSAHSHIAAALDIPSVLIYGPIDPRLRDARSYRQKRILFKTAPCGPCHQLSANCVIYPKGSPPCMQQYEAEDIIAEANRALVGDFGVDDHTTKLLTGIYYEDAVRQCPVCNVKNVELLTRKQGIFYVRCKECNTIYSDHIAMQGDISRGLPSGKAFAKTLKQVAQVHIQDPVSHCSFPKHPELLDELVDWPNNISNNLISIIYGLETATNPKQLLETARNKCSKILFIYGHDASLYPRNNAWLPLNTKVVGSNLQILTKDRVCQMLKDLHCEIIQARTINNMDYMITAEVK